MERDLLTDEEIRALIFDQGEASTPGWGAALQAAARLGAERERESIAADRERLGCGTCAVAIRRGEGEQA